MQRARIRKAGGESCPSLWAGGLVSRCKSIKNQGRAVLKPQDVVYIHVMCIQYMTFRRQSLANDTAAPSIGQPSSRRRPASRDFGTAANPSKDAFSRACWAAENNQDSKVQYNVTIRYSAVHVTAHPCSPVLDLPSSSITSHPFSTRKRTTFFQKSQEPLKIPLRAKSWKKP